MEKFKKVCYLIIGLGLVAFGAWIVFETLFRNPFRNPDTTEQTVIRDTVYDTVHLDSIEYNIKTQDSVIVKLKEETIEKINESDNLDDSCAVEQFKQLSIGE